VDQQLLTPESTAEIGGDGETIVAALDDHPPAVWSLEYGVFVLKLRLARDAEDNPPTALEVGTAGGSVVVTNRDGTFDWFSLRDGKQIATLRLSGGESRIGSSPDKHRLATVRAGLLRVFDAPSRTDVGPMIQVGSDVCGADFSDGGQLLAVKYRNGSFQVWDVEAAISLTERVGHGQSGDEERLCNMALRFLDDDRYLVASSGHRQMESPPNFDFIWRLRLTSGVASAAELSRLLKEYYRSEVTEGGAVRLSSLPWKMSDRLKDVSAYRDPKVRELIGYLLGDRKQ
jgi:WD40 repeat protein